MVQTQEIANFADEKGVIISKDALELLLTKTDWKETIEELSQTDNPIINKDTLLKKMLKTKFSGVMPEVEIRKTRFNAYAKDRKPNFRIMSEYDVTGQSHCEGKKEDFLRLFRSKYKLISNMLKAGPHE